MIKKRVYGTKGKVICEKAMRKVAKGTWYLQESIHAKKITGWGWVSVAMSPKGICKIGLGAPPKRRRTPLQGTLAWKAFEQIERYLKKNQNLKLKIDLKEGTPFQKQVWNTLQKIPYGKTRSYKWVAQKIKKPKAFRAVGQACGANPAPLIIPCHRVTASNGKIGGFSGPLSWKQRLLRLEGVALK